jgi:quercetin dioxygenase-like cupin family protein
MITTPSSTFSGEGADRRIDGPHVCFDLPMELARLRAEGAYRSEGHVGRTLTKYPDLRVVLEAMKAGERMPLHETAERMTLQVVVGQLRVRTEDGDGIDLADGSFAAFDARCVHEIECLHECAFLLTLAWPPRAPGRRARGGEASAGLE